MSDDKHAPEYEGWAILELMGHRRLGGYVREATLAGSSFLRIDVPDVDATGNGDGVMATQYYSPGSVYCLTPTTEPIARALAKRCRPTPVQQWELPSPRDATVSAGTTIDEDGDDDDVFYR